jgi:hypothetical protein
MNDKTMEVYRNLLVEIKYRVGAIDAILQKQIPLRAKIAEELCYLQLRMVCELVAIGCLVIHREMGLLKTDLFKTYKADWIMSELGKLHPKFFPIALEQQDSVETDPPSWVHKKSGFLTRDGLSRLWSKAGSNLHRGSARNILIKDRPLDFESVRGWRDQIVGLLTRHIITSSDENNICYFIMNDGQDRVHSALFNRLPGD